MRLKLTSILLLSALCLCAQSSLTNQIFIILDGSGSMWQKLDGEHKVTLARSALKELMTGLPDETEVGLLAYGHRRKDDCSDIELLLPMAGLDRTALQKIIDELNPTGKTPITAAIEESLAHLGEREATVILLSDGLETCEGDPCATVRLARSQGKSVLFHVIGFGLEEDNVSQLECIAQAGGGRYFDAQDAEGLAGALQQAVQPPAPEGMGYLSVKALVNGQLEDVSINVFPEGGREAVGGGRTYTSELTNPRIIPLPAGTYDVSVKAVRFEGKNEQRLTALRIMPVDTLLRVVDFSTGTLSVGVSRNGDLSDAALSVYQTDTRTQVAGGRTYRSESSNPVTFELTPGRYDLEAVSVEIEGKVTHRIDSIRIGPGQAIDTSFLFTSGTLRIGVMQGEERIDAVVQVYSTDTGRHVAGGRTYTGAKTNPRAFELAPGTYRVVVSPAKRKDLEKRELTVKVSKEKILEETVRY